MHGACLLLTPIPFYQETGSHSHSFFFFCSILSFVLLTDITNTLLPTMKISNLIMAASAASLVHARDVIKKRASGFTCKHLFPLKL